MARKRQIKPEFFESEEISRLSFGARILYIGIWCHMDANGIIERFIPLIRSKVFPREVSVTDQHVSDWIDELCTNKQLARVTAQGKQLLVCPNFRKHQKVHPDEPAKYSTTFEELPTTHEQPPSGLQTGCPTTHGQPPCVPLTLTLTLNSDSNSDFDSNLGASNSSNSDAPQDSELGDGNLVEKPKAKKAATGGKEIIAAYCDAFRARYGTAPTITGKDAGIASRLAKDLGQTKAIDLIGAYLSMNDPFFLTKRHDLPTFATNLNAVTVKLMTGVGSGANRAEARSNANQNALADYVRKLEAVGTNG
jgi:hypothetical protein